EPRVCDLVRGEIQNLREHAEGLVFVEKPDGEKIGDLQKEAADLLQQRRLGPDEFAVEYHHLFLRGEPRLQFPEGPGGMFRNSEKHTAERAGVAETFEQDDIVD